MVFSAFIGAGKTPNAARKTTMAICALLIAPIFMVPFVHQLWVVVALLGMATAGHQGWSANLFTLPSDLFPKSAVASVTGIGGMAGAVSGVMLQLCTGVIVTVTHSYVSLFILACLAYPLALIVIQFISPRLAPAHMN
jgi:ACS family hexuronate transporter-like MFS transporter